MIEQTKHLIGSRELIRAWTGRIVRGRYQQSALGWLWAIVQPVATTVIFSIIFTYIVPVDTGDVPYILFSFTAIVPWTLLATSLGDMASSLVQNMSLVSKINFPREALPIAAMLARLLDFGVSFLIVIVMMFIYQVQVSPSALLFLPVILAVQIALILGVGLACSALNVFYRDVDPLIKLVIQVWFYASPIIYPVSMVPEKLLPYYFLNPMAGILVGYRDVLLNSSPPGLYLLPSIIEAIVLLIVGYWFFRRVEYQFADII